jgi:probable F420-dependent oxidoreductase
MKFGLSPLQAGGDFEDTIRECERAEAAGFDSVWLGEHHNNRTLYPAPLVGLAAIASRTRTVRLGTAVLLLPLYWPLAVAEEGAMVDMISSGRLILGVGAGYAPEEFAAFDVSLKERASRLDEAVPLIQRLWTEEKVTHAGRHYRVTSATVYPRPVQRPRPPIWFGGWVDPAVRRAGRLGEAWLGGPSAKLDEVAGCVRLYREARKEAGRDPATGEVALMRYVFVAESVERARGSRLHPGVRGHLLSLAASDREASGGRAHHRAARGRSDRPGRPGGVHPSDRALPEGDRARPPDLPGVRARYSTRRGGALDESPRAGSSARLRLRAGR